VVENRVLRRIFGPKRVEMTRDWRKLHNEELHNFYTSPNIIRMIKPRRMRWAGHVARMGETRNAYRVLVGKPEGKRSLGRLKIKWVGNIKTLKNRTSLKRFVSLQFRNHNFGRTPWMGYQPVARPVPIGTQNKHRQTSVP
jgi:hypothetical protein